MIIIAIPKSASTSLMLTLGKYHNMEAKQDFSFTDNPTPEGCRFIHQLHSDIRELNPSNIELITGPDIVDKNHVFPSDNNLNLLKDIKKVVLLRSPKEIVQAYRRGAQKKVHNLIPGYDVSMSESDWFNQAKKDGLWDDLNFFYDEWKEKADPETTLFINYQEYVDDPQTVFNKIESFYGLPLTKENVETIKARYSRRKGLSHSWIIFKNGIKNFVKSVMKTLGLRK